MTPETNLPPPRRDGPVSLESALARRRSVRSFHGTPLPLADLSQLLWATQGSVAEPLRPGVDIREELARAAVGQEFL